MNLVFRLWWLRLRARRRGPLSVWDVARTPFRVLPTDLDLLFHMNNGKYLSILDLGRLDLLLRSGLWQELTERGWYPVVAGQTISYRRSLRLWQRFEVHTRVLGFDDRWGYIEQTFVVGMTVHAQAIVRSRFLKRSGGSVTHDELEQVAGPLADHAAIPDWVLAWSAASRIPGRIDEAGR